MNIERENKIKVATAKQKSSVAEPWRCSQKSAAANGPRSIRESESTYDFQGLHDKIMKAVDQVDPDWWPGKMKSKAPSSKA
jgi:hypothetical protein